MKTRGIGRGVPLCLVVWGVMVGGLGLGWPDEAGAVANRASVKRDGVPVYAQMATTSDVVAVLRRGDVATVDFALTGPEGAWCHIVEAGRTKRTGYVRCEDLERESAPTWSAIPAQPAPRAGGHRRDVAREIREFKKFLRGQSGGETPLMRAAAAGDTAMVKATLGQGANPNDTNQAGETALMFAAERGHLAGVLALLAAGSAVDARGTPGETALMYAARRGHTSVVQSLVAAGADVNAREENTIPVLQLAAQEGHTATVQVLLAAGADVNAQTGGGYTALMWAAQDGRVATVRQLLAAGADVNMRNQGGGTALLMAQSTRHTQPRTEMIRMLKEAGAQE